MTALAFMIDKVDDPPGQAIAITIALDVSGNERFDLGAISVFPSEAPAPFTVPLSKEAQAAIGVHPDQVALLLRLSPVTDQSSLREGLSVVVTFRGPVSR